MNVNFKLLPEAVVTAQLDNKQAVLERVAEVFGAVYRVDPALALEGLEERERLGSTGFGRGIALPHARHPDINRPVVVLLRLESPVEFQSADGMPVDLVFGLLSPENAGATHLYALAALSRLARDEAVHQSLIDAPNAEALYALVANVLEWNAA